MNRRFPLFMVLLVSVLVVVLAPFFGTRSISVESVLRPGTGGVDPEIFWKIRVPRVLVAYLSGAVLALSGMVFQALFRNPLATPFTLGVSSGAAFGAALYVRAGILFSIFGVAGQSLSAFAGALFAIFLVYGLTRVRRGFTTATMLLAGVAVSFFFSSLILFIQYVSDFTRSFRILRWLMGGFEVVGFRSVLLLSPFVVFGSAAVFLLTRELNLFLLGEDIAASRGVSVGTVKTVLFFVTSFMVGGVVSMTGPIGFVGMMAPHMCRLIIGHDHRFLAPAAFLFGGAFLTCCDTLSRTLIAPAEIPVGVITALLGGPFFLWLLLTGSSEKSVLGE